MTVRTFHGTVDDLIAGKPSGQRSSQKRPVPKALCWGAVGASTASRPRCLSCRLASETSRSLATSVMELDHVTAPREDE